MTSSLHPKWFASLSELNLQPDSQLHTWMHAKDSLTEKAQQQCQTVSINLRQQYWGIAEPTEAQLLHVSGTLFIREIVMMCDGDAWWFARTLIPSRTFFIQAEQFSQLQNQPLGTILFSSPSHQRKYCEFAVLSPEHFIFQQALQNNRCDINCLWARRSQFMLLGGPLLLYEVFLPAMLRRLHSTSTPQSAPY